MRLIQILNDSHLLESVNSGSATNLVRIAVCQNTAANMVAGAAALGNPPTLRISAGDDVPFAKGQRVSTIFPIDENGASVSGTSHCALSLQDCLYDCRVWKRKMSTIHRDAMFIRTQGNHDGGAWWHYSANNGAVNDAATHSYQAFNTHFGNPASSPLWSGDANGLWGSIRIGNVLVCIFNPYPATILRTTSPADLPTQPDNNNDWTIDPTQWNHFFSETSGTIATADTDEVKFVLPVFHNILGGASPVSFESYGWGGARYIAESRALGVGEVYETGPGDRWEDPYGKPSPQKQYGLHRAFRKYGVDRGLVVVCVYGHAHFYARQYVEGVWYILNGRAAGVSAVLGDYGFRTSGGWWDGATWTDTHPESVFRSNAGHLDLIQEDNRLTVRYIRSLVSGQTAQDGINTNGATADELVLYAMPATKSMSAASVRQGTSKTKTNRQLTLNQASNRQAVLTV